MYSFIDVIIVAMFLFQFAGNFLSLQHLYINGSFWRKVPRVVRRARLIATFRKPIRQHQRESK